jgi:hypothetical protein
MAVFPKTDVLIVNEAGSLYKYPHPLDLAEILARANLNVTVIGPYDANVIAWNEKRGFIYLPVYFYKCIPGILNILRFTTISILCGLRAKSIVCMTTTTLPVALALSMMRKHVIYYALELDLPKKQDPIAFSAFQYIIRYTNIKVFTTAPQRSRMLKCALHLKQLPGYVECCALSSTLTSVDYKVPTIKETVHEKLGRNVVLVVSVNGGLSNVNCLDIILEASILVGPTIAFALTGPKPPRLEEQIKQVNASGGCCLYLGEILGARAQLIEALKGVDVGLVLKRSSRNESWNDRLYTANKLFDFIAAGVWTICSRQITMDFVERLHIGEQLDYCGSDSLARSLLSYASLSKAERMCRSLMVRRQYERVLHYEISAKSLVETILAC